MKIHEYNQMMKYLTRQEPPSLPPVASGEQREAFAEGDVVKAPELSKSLKEVYGKYASKIKKGTLTGLQVLGTPAVSTALYVTDVVADLKKAAEEGSLTAKKALDALVGQGEKGLYFLLPELAKDAATSPIANKILQLGKIGRFATPVGLGLSAAGVGKDFYDQYKAFEALSPEEKERRIKESTYTPTEQDFQQMQEAESRASAAKGGRIGYAMGGRIGFQEGGDIRKIIKEFEKEGTTPNSFVGPNGIEFKLVTGQFSGKPVYKAFYPKDYDFSKGAIGGSTATEFQPEYFFKHIMAPEGTYFDYEKNDFLPTVSTPEVPTIDPFSGQQVSAQEQATFTQPQDIFPQQELPTVTPEAPFQPYEGQTTPYDFISNRLENVVNNPAIKGFANFVTGSESPFQDISQFTSSQQSVINQAIENAAKEGRTNITYADYPQTGVIAKQIQNDGFSPGEYVNTLISSVGGNPVDQIKTTLGQFDVNPQNQIVDKYDFSKQLGNNLGTPYPININLANQGPTVQERYNKYLASPGSETVDDLYKSYRASIDKKANGGRIGFANGSNEIQIPTLTKKPTRSIYGKYASQIANSKVIERGPKQKGKLGPEDPLSKYESYSEEELAGNIEAKKPNFDTLEDYILQTMPIFEPKDVAPPKSYSPMPVEEYLRRRYQIDLAKGGSSNPYKIRKIIK